jgi:hypothetical protein
MVTFLDIYIYWYYTEPKERSLTIHDGAVGFPHISAYTVVSLLPPLVDVDQPNVPSLMTANNMCEPSN